MLLEGTLRKRESVLGEAADAYGDADVMEPKRGSKVIGLTQKSEQSSKGIGVRVETNPSQQRSNQILF